MKSKRLAVVVSIAVLVHLLAAVLLRPYGDLMVSVGGWFSHANDIADLPRLFALGSALSAVAIALVVAGVACWAYAAEQ